MHKQTKSNQNKTLPVLPVGLLNGPKWGRVFQDQSATVDSFSGRLVVIEGWAYSGGAGLFDSYTSAVAAQLGLWEEYCEFHRNKIGEVA